MLGTKSAAELCVLLIDELYGQLPSRVFAALLARGRSNVGKLVQQSSLNPKQVRHGLVVLIQQNLIFYHTDPDAPHSLYEANPSAAYNLVRVGKILDMVENQYGRTAKLLVHDVILLGQIEIAELVRHYKHEHCAQKKDSDGEVEAGHNGINGDDHTNPNHINGNGTASSATEDEYAEPEDEEVYDILAQLIASGFIESVTASTFQSPEDLRTGVEQEVMKDFPNGLRGAKQTNEFDTMVMDELKSIHGERTALKRKLQDRLDYEPNIKRRKLTNCGWANGFVATGGGSLLDEEFDTMIRLNHDKCIVELRNQKLAEHVEDIIGDTTAQVYGALLRALSKKISRCRVSGILSNEEADFLEPRVSTDDVFEHLSPSVDVSFGIGTASEDTIDIRYAEKIRRDPPQLQDPSFQDGLQEGDVVVASDDEYDETGELTNGAAVNGSRRGSKPGQNGTKVKGEDGGPLSSQRLRQMRQHLLILAESKQQFVRHCGAGQWTVDFGPLLQRVRFIELDTMIEESFGRQGLRLTRILREKGKIDDKTLPTMALMRKPDVHVKMAEMEMAGFLDVQEVPRDNNRAANRTMFFWFFDEERTLRRILDSTYKSMVRCLERLEVERRRRKNVLSVTERRDVQGKEKDMLRSDVYSEWLEFLEVEKKLLGQIGRMDDLVAILRDY
ncbi:Uu.00g066640.m01.CDS01 [Anthostomella pinea]|uniref:DNA-directed RNA polymerase III subunit RPC3 n=1 Tax=Anthostomella pinea TaxID=933095 RepID=A0AAI8VUS8_9PEZI|nr:Uu.00g066640.m01.CDS01 [Anthostomella pinea]